jgi:hypothetical protein
MFITNFKTKFVCVFLVFVILLQSCTVYKKAPVSISEASTTNHKVLIIKNDDTKLELKKIELVDGVYYGFIDEDRGIVKIPLNESTIKTIRIIDKSASTLLSTGIVVIPLAIIITLVIANWGPGNLDLGE